MASLALYLLASLGAITALVAAYQAVQFALIHLIHPREPLRSYKRCGSSKPSYALITGASAGIGLGVAKELSKQGFGVILLGHLQDELALARQEILASTPDASVRLVTMNAITATPEDLQGLVDSLQDLDVSILVNNVGGSAVAMPPFRPLDTYSCADVDVVIDQNARFMARLTALVLPLLSSRSSQDRRSLVVNMSSQGLAGVPWIVMYGATKAFNLGFSVGLARELELDPATKNVDCIAVIPGDVLSQGNSRGVTKSAPTAAYFGQRIVYSVDAALRQRLRAYSPYWLHDIQWRMMAWVGEDTLSSETAKVIRMKKEAWNQYHEKSD